uniref:RNA polymerase subunit beta n=1 Tax=Phacus arnoldii TaxID=298292 RepID=UPI0023AB33AF|nr:RNA polymerase subunit beta [Phacus arnoldii]WCH63545.1 RNA polymerase subunit beta [Phacus arnoldii]
MIEDTNPLTEITHKRKISLTIDKSSSQKSSNLEIREIHSSHKGKICPIETAEGKNAGLIWSLAKEARINKFGFLESPFYSYRSNQLQTISSIQIISLGTSLIPYLEHNDANRALMGSNMQRQAISLIKKESPIVGTGVEKIIANTSESTIKSQNNCLIKYTSSKKIIVHEKIKIINPIYKKLNKFSKNFLKKITKITKKNEKYKKYIKKTYYLKRNKYSSQNTLQNQTSNLNNNEWSKKGRIIADGSATNNGELNIGKNVLIGYMPWHGYNFEDAIVISERLVKENIFTSIHIKKYKVFLIKNETGEEKFSRKIPSINEIEKKKLKRNGLIKNGSFVKENEIVVGKIKKRKQSSTTKLLNILFGKNQIINSSFKLPKRTKGTVIGVKVIKQKSVSIIIYLSEKRKIQIGDKISGRHGNKGIVSKILPIEDMPFLQDGTILDIILNPLGIPSRMNVGQVFECLMGICGKNLKEKYRIVPFKNIKEEEISRLIVFNKLFEASNKTKKKWIFNPNYPGKMKIINGKTAEIYKQPITIGYSYILKLMHLVKDKLTARNFGLYSVISKQPLKGKARNGGQRFGEMEVWAVEGFGCAYVLQELMTIKSDNLNNRYKILNSIIKSGPLPKPEVPEAFKVFILELNSLCINISIYNPENQLK